ncbi:hypothetical protein RHSIM_Rhsim06G0123200 [Rhododendron simsii]|uniref:non-specific serine/threonine protein kinase n=1 Tax=Rhododendron simsii TaxID=118357 RepID=A0A834LNG5_RHOSS|nr:hypothetical protein RHSIM_Rhsim06G0123200 [Rhododendron simsii]
MFSLSVEHYHLVGYLEAYRPLLYYETILAEIPKRPMMDEEAYVAFKNGSFNGQHISVGSTAQFMRLEPDGHLNVYEWGGAEWMTMADLLSSSIGNGDCRYPMACGKYGICSANGQCSCFEGSSNETGNFKQMNDKQPNLGCSLVTPISCNYSQYSLLELKNTGYFNYRLDDQTTLVDCKNACLRNCSCKAAIYAFADLYELKSGCMLLDEVVSLINNEGGSNVSVLLKVLQNSPPKQSSPTDFPRKKSRHGKIILGFSLGALIGVCLLVGSCIFVFKSKGKEEELDDGFSFDKVPGMPTRFLYDGLKTATNDFSNKLGVGGFGSVFRGTLSDGTEVAVQRLDGLSQIKKSFLAEVQTIGNIHHVNLVRLIGFCAENSNRLLVYEYMCNGSLDRWLFKGHQKLTLGWIFKIHHELTLGWESRRKIIADIAKGLAYLHEECRQKIYHLDIKPQNIRLDENSNAKVSDFGLAKLIDKDQSQVLATLAGTPGYMAPEWLSSIITEKVDVYSFGVVVLEILCGRKNLDRSQPEEDRHLFKRKGEEGQLLDMVDKYNANMQVLEELVSVQDNLDYNFINAPARRTVAATGEDMYAIHDGTTLFAVDLSGPRKRGKAELDDEFSVHNIPGMPTQFSYNDLKTATNDFNNKLGEGGFGSVFKGTLSDGTEVAVKRFAGLSQIKKSFLAEVQTIGIIHHVNLVKLIGFCAENSNRLLVYKYMSNGSLDRWIFKRHQELTLGWESRRKIIADIAKGLAYLHEGCRQKIYHLDVKPQNILLDENFEAKVSDFGLAKLIDKDQSRIVATLRGTPGYMAPEWLSSIITEKVDVYSFGVVVLEILCGRKNLDRSQPEEEMHLLGLFKRKGEEGQLLDMVDKYNADMQLHGAEVVEMMKLAVWCLQSDYQRRPSMTVAVQVLEGSVSVQDNLDYDFINAPARRTMAARGEDVHAIDDGTPLLASVLSGPR